MDVNIVNLKRHFGNTRAVDDISFCFSSGDIFGFVGPNGAGKTTTMRILATLDDPTEGNAYVNGISLVEDPEKARCLVGFMPDSLPAHRDMTVHDYLDFFARAYGLRGAKRRSVVDSVEEFANLKGIREKLLRSLSKGMKQRVSLARALVHDPPVLVLDEPAAGLDPRARVELRELLKVLADRGKAILISSHILTELAEICNGAVIIEHGRILRAGPMSTILSGESPHRLVVVRAVGGSDALQRELLQTPAVCEVRTAGEAVEFRLDGGDDAQSSILAHLIGKGFQVIEYHQRQIDLEEVFMTVTKGESDVKRLIARAGTGDWVNAVAVKEFRQAVRSRWVIAILMLFLLVNVMFVGSYLALSTDAATNARAGHTTLATLLGILMVTCVGFVPLYSGLRLSLERNDSNIDLLFITTIRPAAIVRGKYLSAMALTLLIFSACMPFMVLTYLLGGVDVPTILFLLAAAFAACAVANAVGIFAGSVSGSWLFRGLAAVASVIVLCYIGGGTIAMLGEMLVRGLGIAAVSAGQFWSTVATAVFMASLTIGLFYVLSVALLSPVLANRMLVPRIYLIVTWIATGSVMAIWSWHEHEAAPIMVWMVGGGIVWMITAVAAMGERDTWTSRVRRSIPRNPLTRVLAFLLYTGSAGGVILSTIMFAATVGATYCIFNLFYLSHAIGRDSLDEVVTNLSIVFGYILCYCLTTAFLRITIFRRLPTVTLSVITVIVAGFAMIVPFILGFIFGANMSRSAPWYMLASPMVLTTNERSAAAMAGPFVIGWLALGIVLSARWAFGQWRHFIPPETKP